MTPSHGWMVALTSPESEDFPADFAERFGCHMDLARCATENFEHLAIEQ
jgi:hypothetical protein